MDLSFSLLCRSSFLLILLTFRGVMMLDWKNISPTICQTPLACCSGLCCTACYCHYTSVNSRFSNCLLLRSQLHLDDLWRRCSVWFVLQKDWSQSCSPVKHPVQPGNRHSNVSHFNVSRVIPFFSHRSIHAHIRTCVPEMFPARRTGRAVCNIVPGRAVCLVERFWYTVVL